MEVYGISSSSATIKNCTNFADLLVVSGNKDSNPYIGGIIGTGQATTYISNCTNSGNITAKSLNKGGYIGGISGNERGTISNCTNSGEIHAQGISTSYVLYIGGIAGYTTDHPIYGAYNTGDISWEGNQSGAYIGGIVGQISSSNANIENSYNSGAITNRATSSSSYSYIAGIAGQAQTIRNCYNTGDVAEASSSVSNEYVGGIAGNAKRIEDAYNTGDVIDTISSASTEYVGGIVGYGNYGTLKNTYNIGNVYNGGYTGSSSSSLYTGEIYGYGSGSSGDENHYLDDIDVIGPNTGKNSGNLPMCEECTEEHMRTDEFCEELKGESEDSKWIQEENQYPTLDIGPMGSTDGATEITIGNIKKTFDITAQIGMNSAGSRTGGSITGNPTKSSQKYVQGLNEDKNFIEEVRYGEANTVTVDIKPDTNYIIQKITINGKEIGFTTDDKGNCVLPAKYFENVTEDINIVANFVEQSKSLTINKTDEDGNKLAGAKFKLESDKETESNVIRDLTKNGRYGFIKSENGLIPENVGMKRNNSEFILYCRSNK